MTITSNFLKKIIQDFLYRVDMADADFRQKFLTKILNPQMEILTQSQIIFWENSNFQNRLNQQILTPKFVNLSDFENLNFPKKLFDFESKFPFVGSKFFVRNFCRKSASAIYTLYKKSWIIFFKKFGVIVIFDLRGGKMAFF